MEYYSIKNGMMKKYNRETTISFIRFGLSRQMALTNS